jgi:hypothetical protein
MRSESILYVTDAIFGGFLHITVSTSASLEYIEYAGTLLPLLIAYSSDVVADNA